ncbi:hypothetical protein P280DRAFT_485650 [Massarina eburnea CBS 473.64]|uniref:F-box domain-containing protein n=1 Tax=Massarina eburnea CBS 473.64 TaxID=1395130 RepID=A0A6A6RIG5_9PLEO|nr:hypothetical protein P280DRAFT_485650 [Massarina eburnea CBS 473.64]
MGCFSRFRLRGRASKTMKQRQPLHNPPAATELADLGSFRFVDLPAELRNRVYGFATESSQPVLNGENLVCLTREGKSTSPNNWKRQFFGLTQVSRQVREEFHRLYHQSSKVHVNFSEAPAYMETFLKRIPGVLGIVVPRMDAGYCRGHPLMCNAEVKGLLTSLTKFPHVNVNFSIPTNTILPSEETRMANSILCSIFLENRDTWMALLMDRLDAIVIDRVKISPSWALTMHFGEGSSWSTNTYGDDDVRRLLPTIGLEDAEHWVWIQTQAHSANGHRCWCCVPDGRVIQFDLVPFI